MEYQAFLSALKRDPLPHVFLLAGAERYFVDRARTAIFARLFPGGIGLQDGLQRLTGTADVEALLGYIETAPFFADKNVVLVTDAAFASEKKESDGAGKARAKQKMDRLLAVLADMPAYSYVVFQTEAKPDKRKKFCKTIEKAGLALDADPVRAWNIGGWLTAKLQAMGKELDRDAYDYFTGAVSMMREISLEYLDGEFDKLTLFSNAPRITKREMMTVCAGIPEVSSFALLDAISERKVEKALMLLRRQLADGTYFTILLALMTRHVRQLWQAVLLQKKGVRGRALAKPLELNPFIAEKLGRAAMQFPEYALKDAMLALIDADYLLKTGQAGDELLEHAVITLCTAPRETA